ncbi:MAG: hypothetical protein GWO86_03955 [Planctomycetes bacterium]|nr:hypothetical protein [Planctomycetota bacterium]
MLKFFLCLKYLRKKKIVLLSITAVALSSALLVTVASLFTGFIDAINISASDTLGDIVLEPPGRFTRYDEFIRQLQQSDKIDSASAVLYGNGLLLLGKGNVRAVAIWGIDPAQRDKVTGMKTSMLRQKDSGTELTFDYNDSQFSTFVGIGLVDEPDGLSDEYDMKSAAGFIGKKAVLTMAVTDLNSRGQKTKKSVTQLTIADIVFTGIYDIDRRFIFLPIDKLTERLYPGQADEKFADIIHIKCAPGYNPTELLGLVDALWSDFASNTLNWRWSFIKQTRIITAVQKQSQYVAELKKQMGMLLLIFGVISGACVLLIFCIFYMIVMTKLKDVAIIKAVGAGIGKVTLIFIIFGLCVGVIGAILGVSIGYIVTVNVNTIEQWIRIIFGLKLWSSSAYIFSTIPNQFDWYWALWVSIAAVVASALGALVPAIIAAKTKPVRILRYE